jgi:hypothetical protein
MEIKLREDRLPKLKSEIKIFDHGKERQKVRSRFYSILGVVVKQDSKLSLKNAIRLFFTLWQISFTAET